MRDQVKNLVAFMTAADRAGALELVDTMREQGINDNKVITEVLDPALIAFGKLWGKQEVSLSQTYVAAKIAEGILNRCSDSKKLIETEKKGRVVLGNIEDDFHGLGRRVVKSFAEASGWDVIDLGCDVLAEDFIESALKEDACIIGVSAMMQTSALNIRKVRELIDERSLSSRIKLAVGGAVFNWRKELISEVGADGSCSNASEADALFTQLLSSLEASS
jgi:methylmalonyl-CoA mutase cobalamin-binding domain/chain